MIIMGTTDSYLVMILCRIVLGLAEGPQFALLAKTVTRWFPPSEHGRANSIWMVGAPLGSAIGFPLTIWLVHTYGWRASFFVLAAFSLVVVMPLVFLVLTDWPVETTQQQKDALERSAVTGSSMAADLQKLAGNVEFWLMVVLNIGTLVYLWGLTSWLPTYLEKARGLKLGQVGIFSSLPFFLTFFAEIASGVVSDWLGKRAILSFAGLLGAGVLMYFGSQASDPYTAATLIALSSGSWGFAVPGLYAMAYAVIPKRLTASGIGMVNGVGNLMGALTPVVMGAILASTGSYNAGLMVIVLGPILFGCAALPLVRKY
jgi:nitrate/nitrite transporter NarK